MLVNKKNSKGLCNGCAIQFRVRVSHIRLEKVEETCEGRKLNILIMIYPVKALKVFSKTADNNAFPTACSPL